MYLEAQIPNTVTALSVIGPCFIVTILDSRRLSFHRLGTVDFPAPDAFVGLGLAYLHMLLRFLLTGDG